MPGFQLRTLVESDKTLLGSNVDRPGYHEVCTARRGTHVVVLFTELITEIGELSLHLWTEERPLEDAMNSRDDGPDKERRPLCHGLEQELDCDICVEVS